MMLNNFFPLLYEKYWDTVFLAYDTVLFVKSETKGLRTFFSKNEVGDNVDQN